MGCQANSKYVTERYTGLYPIACAHNECIISDSECIIAKTQFTAQDGTRQKRGSSRWRHNGGWYKSIQIPTNQFPVSFQFRKYKRHPPRRGTTMPLIHWGLLRMFLSRKHERHPRNIRPARNHESIIMFRCSSSGAGSMNPATTLTLEQCNSFIDFWFLSSNYKRLPRNIQCIKREKTHKTLCKINSQATSIQMRTGRRSATLAWTTTPSNQTLLCWKSFQDLIYGTSLLKQRMLFPVFPWGQRKLVRMMRRTHLSCRIPHLSLSKFSSNFVTLEIVLVCGNTCRCSIT